MKSHENAKGEGGEREERGQLIFLWSLTREELHLPLLGTMRFTAHNYMFLIIKITTFRCRKKNRRIALQIII
jgi:hypothetical protein